MGVITPFTDLAQRGMVISQDQMAGRGKAKPGTPVSCFLGAKCMRMTASGVTGEDLKISSSRGCKSSTCRAAGWELLQQESQM